MELNGGILQPSNPTDEDRYTLLKNALIKSGRLQDFNNIIRYLSPPPDILNFAAPGEFKNIKIGIIGGGLAGMTAAFELRKLGCNITILDALEDRIGGRVNTYYFDKNKKYYAELGAMRIPVSHETTWHYINTFRLGTDPFIQNNPNSFVFVRNERARNNPESIQMKIYPKFNLTSREKITPWNKLYDHAMYSIMKKLSPDLRSEILKILPKYSPCYTSLINMSIRQNFEMEGLSPDAINMTASIDGYTGAVLDISCSEALHEKYAENFSCMYRIAGGNTNLPLAFYKSLTSESPWEYADISESCLGKVIWKRGNWVTGIYKGENGRKIILEYKNKSAPKGALESFDFVICAIPFSTLTTVNINPLFSSRKMQSIREINYINAQKTLLYCNRRFWEEDKDYGKINGGVSKTDLPITNILYPSDHSLTHANPDEPGVLIGSYNLNKFAVHIGNINSEDHIELVKRQIEKVHGLYRNHLDSIVTDAVSISWNNEPHFRGGFAYFTPEQKRIFSYEMLKPEYNNRVLFAGEHASVTHGWMQGALHSGKLAANDLAYYAKNWRPRDGSKLF